MKTKRNLGLYTMIWIIAVLILIFSLFQNLGYAKVINYSGIVRGATQKLVKEELNGEADDLLISYLDDILAGLQQGGGTYELVLIKDDEYQDQLKDMKLIWEEMKQEIISVREGNSQETLYQLSQEYFTMADQMVSTAERLSSHKFNLAIMLFFVYVLISGGFFVLWYLYKQRQLNKVRYIDALTGLHNVVGFETALENVKESQDNYVLVYFDLDDFKYINTVYGYNVGNQILIVIGHALEKLVGKGCCARIGNDNFYVCLESTKDCIEQLKIFLRTNLKEEMALDVVDETTITIGAYLIDKQEDIHDMMDNALLAHKNAKKTGKGCTVWYGQDLLNQLNNENMIVKQMHSALMQKEFKLYLQPKFAIPSLEIIGAEALVRWQRANGEFLYPDQFIPLFEVNGFIHELDFYMLEQTCQFICSNGLEDNFSVSVNFSRVTIHQRDFYDSFYEIVDTYKIPHHCIEIEITEGAFNELSKTIIKLLMKLKDDGFVISIDDFGSGYSSLNLLNTLALDEIKIDRGFLSDKNERREQVIGLIVDIANALDMRVICEGIETQADIEMLERLNCKMGQGFYLSKPVPDDEFIKKFIY